MNITIKIVFIDIHHLIDIIKRYHESLRRIYSIIETEISEIDFELILQIPFKIINNSIEFNNLIFILLIFKVYFRIMKMNASSSIITQ